MPHDLSRPFTARMVRGEVPRSTLRGPRFRRLLPTVYVRADVMVTPCLMAQAATLALPDSAWLSHTTAAELQQLPVPSDPRIRACVPTAADRRLTGSLAVKVRQRRPSTRIVDGVTVSTGADLFCELGEMLNLVDLVVVGDAMVRSKMLRPRQLVRAAADVGGAHGPLIRRAAGLVREKVDSPMETRLRLLIVLAGLPEPRVNIEIRDGGFRTHVDLCYPRLKLVIEYDGQQHRSDDLNQWDRDNERLTWFTDNGWELLAVISRGIYRRPQETLERVCAAIRRRGGVVPPLDPEWRLHFPGDAAA